MPDTEYVVLLDEAGNEIGTAPKSSVHGTDTALHLAFSCHVLDDEGRILVTRRALGKQTWPGGWTNSFRGPPRPAHEQSHGGLDLPLPYAELLGDPAFDGPCCRRPGCRHDPVPPSH